MVLTVAEQHTHFGFKNWRKWQHYSKRRPPWIKLYKSLLRSPDFMDQTEARRWRLVGLMLLASERDNQIPNDTSWLRRELNCQGPFDLTGLFASNMLAWCKHCVNPETETETETDPPTPKPNPRAHKPAPASDDFELFWKAYPKIKNNPKKPALDEWNKAIAAGAVPAEITAAATRYRQYQDSPNPDNEFRASPAHARTWLHQQRWNDWGPDKSADLPLSHGSRKVSKLEILCRKLTPEQVAEIERPCDAALDA